MYHCLDKIVIQKTQDSTNQRQSRIETIKKKIYDIKIVLKSSNNANRQKNDSRIEHEHKLRIIRRQRLNEIYKYVFPIEHVSFVDE